MLNWLAIIYSPSNNHQVPLKTEAPAAFFRSPYWRLSLIALLGLAAWSVFNHRNAPPPLIIGAIISETGPAAHMVDVRDGLILAADEINARGGVQGRPLEIVTRDSRTDPAIAQAAFRTLDKERRPLLFISVTSRISLALAPLAEESRAVLAGLVVASPTVSAQNKWSFRFHTSAEHETAGILRILKGLKIGKLGVLYQKGPFGTSVFNLLKQRFEATGGEVNGIPFPARNPDFKTLTSALADREAIYTVGFVKNDGKAIRQLKADGFPGTILAHSGAASLLPKDYLEGVFIAAPVIFNPNFPFARRASEAYRKRFEKPFTHQAANGYDFIHMIAGLLQEGELTRNGVRKALSGGFIHPGIFGALTVPPGARDILYPLHAARIEQGRVAYLRPSEKLRP